MKDRIIINEVGLREFFQKQKTIYNIENKLELIDGLISSGLEHIQLCSFVSNKILPQMSDAEKLYFSAPKLKNITYSAFILNVKGLKRAINCGFKKLETSISLDNKYGLTNTGMDDKRSLIELNNISELSKKHDIKLRIGLQCVWGRKSNNINIEILSDKINKIISMNPYKICLADTTGLATPNSIKKCLKIVIPLINDNLSFSDLKGGDIFKKVLKSPMSFSLRDKLFIETPAVNFFPSDLFFLITSRDFFEDIWFI